MGRMLFGLPAGRSAMVREISEARENTILFLFNFSTRKLSGVFQASGPAGFPLIEDAWIPGMWSGKTKSKATKGTRRQRTPFIAQLPVRRVGPVLPPLPEASFRHLMQYERDGSHKFKFTLDSEQVEQLVSLCIEHAKAKA